MRKKKSKSKLRDYEQVQCPYCSVKRHLRAYLYSRPHEQVRYETSTCPSHGQLWMLPEVVKKLRYPKRKWVYVGDAEFN